jgi:nitrile hydratase
MDGVHDLGGMQDFGPVMAEPDEPVFHEPWEGRVFGTGAILAVGGSASTNTLRYAIERIDPAQYLGTPYYEHWLTAFATLLVEQGVLTREELEERSGAPFPLSRPSQAPPLPHAARVERPHLAVGERVRVIDTHTRGHTRCPRYARGRHGVIVRIDGEFPLPDADIHGDDPLLEPTYSVRFQATELWGDDADARATVSVDLWASYLERA